MFSLNEEQCDTWEEFANALSPTPPFTREVYRLRIAGLVVPLFAASIFITSYMFTKAVWFGVGFGFFGDPVISRGLSWLNRNFPHWEKLLELRNTVLKGVPTNAQLTLTLLRKSLCCHITNNSTNSTSQALVKPTSHLSHLLREQDNHHQMNPPTSQTPTYEA